jgi:seryl-tRNA synthetase
MDACWRIYFKIITNKIINRQSKKVLPFFIKNNTMLQIQNLRTNTQEIKDRLAKKNFKEIQLVDAIIAIDEKRRAVQLQSDDLAAESNAAAKQIGILMREGKKDEVEAIKLKVASHKEATKNLTDQLAVLEGQQYDMLVTLPNTPHSSVPQGNTPEQNEIVREGGMKPTLPENAKQHWDICHDLQLIDFELGTKITGAGFPVYKNKGAKLQRALINYFLDFNIAAGYLEHQMPLMVNQDSAYATGQLPDKEGQMYHAVVDDFYLIPTAEVPLTNIYRDVILSSQEMPVRLTGYTPCFRREAGSYGKDVRGLNRLHQFDKIEIVQITKPEDSYSTLEHMVAHVEKLLQSLEMPYRILRLCGGDMSFASALTYDFEVFSSAQQRWLEVSSVSNFETFQTSRLKCRYKDENGKTQLAHSLNGSALALPRIVASLLENHQQADGSIRLPKVLRTYFGSDKID